MLIEALGLACNRVGEDSEIVAKAFNDDVEMATRFFGPPVEMSTRFLGLPANFCFDGAEAAIHRLKTAIDRSEAAIHRSETAVHRSFELGDSHRRPARAHHSIVVSATPMPTADIHKTPDNLRVRRFNEPM